MGERMYHEGGEGNVRKGVYRSCYRPGIIMSMGCPMMCVLIFDLPFTGS